ncbi:hypothetical protein ACROYT_G042474 [Oculina patagonica]
MTENLEMMTSPGENTSQSEDVDEIELDVFIAEVLNKAKASLRNVTIEIQSLTESSLKDKHEIDSLVRSASTSPCNEIEALNEGSMVVENEHAGSPELPVEQDDKQEIKKIKKRRSLGCPAWFKRRRRRTSAVAPAKKSEKTPQHKYAFEADSGNVDPSFIFKSGHVDVHGNEVFVINTTKVPKSKDKESVKMMCNQVEHFIEKHLSTEKFGLLIHGVDAGSRSAKLNSLQLAKQFYKLLKTSFVDRLAYCLIYQPEFRLKAAVNLCLPFLANEIERKVTLTSSPRWLVIHGENCHVRKPGRCTIKRLVMLVVVGHGGRGGRAHKGDPRYH